MGIEISRVQGEVEARLFDSGKPDETAGLTEIDSCFPVHAVLRFPADVPGKGFQREKVMVDTAGNPVLQQNISPETPLPIK